MTNRIRVINTGEYIVRQGPRIFKFFAKDYSYNPTDLDKYVKLSGLIPGKDQGFLYIKSEDDYPLIFKHTIEEVEQVGLL